MFSGMIQDIATIHKIESRIGKTFTVSSNIDVKGLTIGDSIAVNGACQTVTNIDKGLFSFYSSAETLSLTNLSILKQSDYVNLERPITLNSFLDGHLVQGHVDETAVIKDIQKTAEEYNIIISCSNKVLKYLIHKGSVAIDGVSLTINKLYDYGFKVTVIPLTIKKTIFQYRQIGDIVNIEVDLFSKYVDKLTNKEGQGLSKDFLLKHGF